MVPVTPMYGDNNQRVSWWRMQPPHEYKLPVLSSGYDLNQRLYSFTGAKIDRYWTI